MNWFQVYVVVLGVFLAFGSDVQAQAISGEWTGNFALPGVSGAVYAIAEVDNLLYVGGAFGFAGDEQAWNIAAFDKETSAWVALGNVAGEAIHAMATGPDGVVYVGGRFSAVAGVSAANVARYNPATDQWEALGEGVDGYVDALAIGPDGDLYVGGAFGSAGQEDIQNFARWDGADWDGLGGIGVGDPGITSLAFDGEILYVAGRFSTAGGTQAENVASFDTATMTWSGLGGGVDRVTSAGVDALVVNEDGIYVGGIFDEAIQPDGSLLAVNNVARWDPEAEVWNALGEGAENALQALAFGPSGLLYAGGHWLDDVLRRWDGEVWSSVEPGPVAVSVARPVHALFATGERLYVGFSGFFLFEGNNPNSFLYWYEPADETWGVLGNDQTDGFTDDVLALATAPGGSTYAGGRFRFAGTERADYIAHWNGTAWEPLGQGIDDVPQALLYTDAGTLYAGGRFGEVYQPNGTPLAASRVVAWDPSDQVWRGLGGGVSLSGTFPGGVYALAEDRDGAVYVGGGFDTAIQANGSILSAVNLARWDPGAEAWEALPGGHGLEIVHALAVDAAGALYASGSYTADGTNELRGAVARLAPETGEWTTLREWSFASVRALSVVGDPTTGGALYVGTYSHGVWQWTGEVWTDLGGPEFVYSLALNGDPEAGGELYAGGLNQDTSGPYVQRWDGESWSGLGSGLTSFVSPPLVYALAVGEAEAEGKAALWVGGEFVTAGGEPASCIARWETDDFDTSTEESSTTPQALGLEAYPNPSSGPMVVRYTLPASSAVRLVVYDVLGREVALLADGVQAAGTHEVPFVRVGLASGTYLVRLEVGAGAASRVRTQRVTVVR